MKYNSKANTYKGIRFKSRLETYMYKLFEDAGIKAEYERHKYNILDPFFFPFDCYEKSIKGKAMINKSNKKIRGIVYTPDFVIEDENTTYVVETKGIATPDFMVRFKLFKRWCLDQRKDFVIFMPRNQTQCNETLQTIQQMREAAK